MRETNVVELEDRKSLGSTAETGGAEQTGSFALRAENSVSDAFPLPKKFRENHIYKMVSHACHGEVKGGVVGCGHMCSGSSLRQTPFD